MLFAFCGVVVFCCVVVVGRCDVMCCAVLCCVVVLCGVDVV